MPPEACYHAGLGEQGGSQSAAGEPESSTCVYAAAALALRSLTGAGPGRGARSVHDGTVSMLAWDLIAKSLYPMPEYRPSPSAALEHTWLRGAHAARGAGDVARAGATRRQEHQPSTEDEPRMPQQVPQQVQQQQQQQQQGQQEQHPAQPWERPFRKPCQPCLQESDIHSDGGEEMDTEGPVADLEAL